jgi:hypothetical protein
MTIEEIVEETKQWPGDVVTELVDRIMLAKYGDIDPIVDAAWRAEAHRRRAELESGKVQGIPLEETLAKARKIIHSSRRLSLCGSLRSQTGLCLDFSGDAPETPPRLLARAPGLTG